VTHKWRDIEHKNPNRDLIAEVRSKSLYGLDPVCAKIAAALEAAEAERDDWKSQWEKAEDDLGAAQAENRRLREALALVPPTDSASYAVARAALDGSGDG
jgi:hypothetical protein